MTLRIFRIILKKFNIRLNDITSFIKWFIYIKFPLKKKIFLLGTPDHNNIGDSAIVIAELNFLHKNFPKVVIKEITTFEYINNEKRIARFVGNKQLLCLHGGGNLGNIWYNEELTRYKILDSFLNNPIVIFPQTVFFTDDEKGKQAKADSLNHYEQNKNLSIFARDESSMRILKSLYSVPYLGLTPDIVLSTRLNDYNICNSFTRTKVLFVFREDIEKYISNDIIDKLKLSFCRYCCIETDMITDYPIIKTERVNIVRSKLEEFLSSRLVITDRLHGMIFSAITETPCIVFGNSHHKVIEGYNWIRYLPYIKFADNLEDAMKFSEVLLAENDYSYSNNPIIKYYDSIIKQIKKYGY